MYEVRLGIVSIRVFEFDLVGWKRSSSRLHHAGKDFCFKFSFNSIKQI